MMASQMAQSMSKSGLGAKKVLTPEERTKASYTKRLLLYQLYNIKQGFGGGGQDDLGLLPAAQGQPNSKVTEIHNVLNEMTSTVGSVLMALQFECAQCHNHKYDPISQADFYRHSSADLALTPATQPFDDHF